MNSIRIRRELWAGGEPLYTYNPYTDVDRLVFKLLYLENDYKWMKLADTEALPIALTVERNENSIRIRFKNNARHTFILNPDEYTLLDVNNCSLGLGERVSMEPGEETEWSFSDKDLAISEPLFLRFPYKNEMIIIEI